ncbi:MAG: aminotransferase class I/II-fold pyridoxal phosphate-dependent enzyme [Lachnospiraceae bacterium]|nr:aminotransferase class I/II-fold pyridoxal phosphate-dependent enzyme [Lachnospiraceae bacterium]
MIHRHGGDIYTYGNVLDFSANINFRGMPASVREAARCAVDASGHYPDPDCRTLRRALARREASFYGVQAISPEDLICGNGAAELMFALAAACRPKRALLAVPSFFEYEQALSAVGCEICRFILNPEQGFRPGEDFLDAVWEFVGGNSQALYVEKSCDTPASAFEVPSDWILSDEGGFTPGGMIILGNPNNPTGQLIEKEILAKLVDLCRERQILLVLDESFIDFLSEDDRQRTVSGSSFLSGDDQRRTISRSRFPDENDQQRPDFGTCFQKYNPYLFIIRSFTKMYAMPGIRFGYGLSTDRQLLENMRRLMQPWNVSTIAQEAAAAAAGEEVFARESAVYVAQNREKMMADLQNTGFEVFGSCANFLLIRAPRQLADVCLKAGFLIRDCGNFPGLMQTGEDWGYFRVCVRSREENEALLCAMKSIAPACQTGER